MDVTFGIFFFFFMDQDKMIIILVHRKYIRMNLILKEKSLEWPNIFFFC